MSAVYAEDRLVVAFIGVMEDGHLIRSKDVACTVLSDEEDETAQYSLTRTVDTKPPFPANLHLFDHEHISPSIPSKL
jgi:hypothetical protein